VENYKRTAIIIIMKSPVCCLLVFLSLVSPLVLGEEGGSRPDHHHTYLLPFTGNLGNSTVLLSQQDLQQDLDNNPLDNLSDLRDIHQFDIDLTNYTDHQAVESDISVPAFNDHFDILPQMDTRDYHNSSEESQGQQPHQNRTLNPALYEVVTSVEEEAFDEEFEESSEGMDEKYFTLLENLRKKITAKETSGSGKGREIHQEVNDVRHPLISISAIKPNSMKLLVKPKTLDINSKVRLMYKRVPRNKAAHRKHLDDPIIEIVPLYRYEQEHFIHDLPRGKYIVCGDHSILEVVVEHNCFETIIDRLDNNELQGGVVCIIALAILVFLSCNCYAVYHRCIRTEEEGEHTKS